mmetsp:Transcript_7855/g.21591  ORF Transcript_7855/g.21591 Transcript_7855/m.21591 type:complete len:239 (+) Transcript_7855:179-895(+)
MTCQCTTMVSSSNFPRRGISNQEARFRTSRARTRRMPRACNSVAKRCPVRERTRAPHKATTAPGARCAWISSARSSSTGSAMRSCFRSSPRHVAPCSRPCFRCAAGLAEVRKLCAFALSGLGVELADSADADGAVFFAACTSCPLFSRAAGGSRGKPALAEDDLQGTLGRFPLGTLRCRSNVVLSSSAVEDMRGRPPTRLVNCNCPPEWPSHAAMVGNRRMPPLVLPAGVCEAARRSV